MSQGEPIVYQNYPPYPVHPAQTQSILQRLDELERMVGILQASTPYVPFTPYQRVPLPHLPWEIPMQAGAGVASIQLPDLRDEYSTVQGSLSDPLPVSS